MTASGFMDRVLAHEIDYLNGYLTIDKMEINAELERVGFFKSDSDYQ